MVLYRTHLAFEPYLSFQNVRGPLSSFEKCPILLMKLFKSQECSHILSKANRIQKVRENSSILIQPIGKIAQKIRKMIEKKNQAAYALAFFENSNEIQKLSAYLASEF